MLKEEVESGRGNVENQKLLLEGDTINFHGVNLVQAKSKDSMFDENSSLINENSAFINENTALINPVEKKESPLVEEEDILLDVAQPKMQSKISMVNPSPETLSEPPDHCQVLKAAIKAEVQKLDGNMNTQRKKEKIKEFFRFYSSLISDMIKEERTLKQKVLQLVASPDGNYIVSVNRNKSFTVFKIIDDYKILVSREKKQGLDYAVFSPDSKTLVTCGANLIEFQETMNFTVMKEIKLKQGKAKKLAMSTSGEYLCCIINDPKTVEIYDVATRLSIKTMTWDSQLILFNPLNDDLITSKGLSIVIHSFKDRNLIRKKELLKHQKNVTLCTFTPSFLVSYSADGILIFWERDSYQIRRELKSEGITNMNSSSDGHFLICSTKEKTLDLWEMFTFTLIKQIEGHKTVVNNVIFGVNSKTFFSSDSSEIKSWSIKNFESAQEVVSHQEKITTIALSKKGGMIVTGSDDKTICVWDVFRELKLLMLKSFTETVVFVEFDFDDSHLITFAEDNILRFWNSVSWTEMKSFRQIVGTKLQDEEEDSKLEIVIPYQSRLTKALSSKLMAIAFQDGIIAIWDLVVFQKLGEKLIPSRITALEFSIEETHLILANVKKEIFILNAKTQQIDLCSTLPGIATALKINSLHTAYFFAVLNYKTLVIGLVKTLKIIKQLNTENPIPYEISHIGVAFDTGYLLAGRSDKRVDFFDPLKRYEFSKHLQLTENPTALALLTGGSEFALATNNSFSILSTNSLRKMAEKSDVFASIQGLVMLRGTNHIITTSSNYDLAKLETDSFKEVAGKRIIKNKGPARMMKLSQNEKLLAVCFSNESTMIYIIDTETFEIKFSLSYEKEESQGETNIAIFTINGDKILSAHQFGLVRIWNMTKKEVEERISLRDDIKSLALSPGENLLTAGGDERVLWIYSYPELKKLKEIDMKGGITYLLFSNNRSFFIALDEKGLNVFDTQTFGLMKNIEDAEKPLSAEFSTDDSYLLINHAESSTIWEFPNFAPVKKIKCKFSSFVKKDDIIFYSLNSLGRKELYNTAYDFLRFLSYNNIFSYRDALFAMSSSQVSKMIAQPFVFGLNFNIFHYLCSNDLTENMENLREYIEKFEIFPSIVTLFANDVFGDCPHDYSILNKNFTTLDALIKIQLNSPQTSFPAPVSMNTKILAEIVKLFPDNICDFLEKQVNEPLGDTTLMINARKTNNREKIETVFPYKHVKEEELKKWMSSYKEFSSSTDADSFSVAPSFRVLDIPNMLDVGNPFLDVCRSLPLTNPIFASEIFGSLLEVKWSSIRIHYFNNSVRFISFFLCYFINSSWIFPSRVENHIPNPNRSVYTSSIVFDSLSIAFSVWHMSGELKELIGLGLRQFLSEMWNCLDIIIIALTLVTNSLDLLESANVLPDSTEANIKMLKALHSITLFISWIRMLDFLRGFRKTSFMVRLLIQVVYDMSSFLLILVLMTLGFAFSGFLIQDDYSSSGSWVFFKVYYLVLLGDFGRFFDIPNQYDSIFWVFFLAFTLFLVIVMLNLLIAIISDSYDKVIAVESMAFSFERLQIIVKTEKLLPRWTKRKLRERLRDKYLHIVRLREKRENEINFEERIRGKVENIEKIVWKLDSKIEGLIKKNSEEDRKNLEEALKRQKEELLKEQKEEITKMKDEFRKMLQQKN